jgi:hypothetical protein
MDEKKKPSKKKPNPKAPQGGLHLSIDLNALEKLYRRRYEVRLDGDTKGGLSVRMRDGDTKGGLRDGDTKGGLRDGDTKG